MHKYYIGLDNGGTSCKAVIFDDKGVEISKASRMLKMITPSSFQTERNMDELWEKNAECIKEAITISKIDPILIKGIACSGHGKGLYLWGKDNKPTRNGIVSTDGRAHDIIRKWKESGIDKKVYETNYQNILACQPVALLKWLKENEIESYNNIKWIFEVKDYIRFCLTGEAFAEITDYSGSNLMDLSKNEFSKDLLSLFGIEEVFNCLPPLKKSVDICGYVTEEVSKLTLLPVGIPVAGGMFDIDACSIAMNIVDSNNICSIAGTWSINEYISSSPVTNHTVMMNSHYCLDNYYLVEECSATSAGNLEWYINKFLKYEVEQAKINNSNIYKYCDDLVEAVEPEDQDIIFLPFIYGSNYNASSKASFIGLDSHHNQSHIIRSVFEGIVFCHMIHIEKLLQNKKDFKSIRLAGGAANSNVWTQMFADVSSYPIEVVKVKELGALGCAMAASVACGDYSTLEIASKNMTTLDKTIMPREDYKKIYKDKFNRYKALYVELEKFWD
jgi:L-xylulokinase